jgi:hypothetical protein
MTRHATFNRPRRGTVSLEAILSLGVTFVVGFVGFQIAVKGYRALHALISLWIGSPFF